MNEERYKEFVLPELWETAKKYQGRQEFQQYVLFSNWIKEENLDYQTNLTFSKSIVSRNGPKCIKSLFKELQKLDEKLEVFPVNEDKLEHTEFVEIVLSVYIDLFVAFLSKKNCTLKKSTIISSSNISLNVHTESLLIELNDLENRRSQNCWRQIKKWKPSLTPQPDDPYKNDQTGKLPEIQSNSEDEYYY